MAPADFHVDDNHDAEMHGVETELHRDGQQDRANETWPIVGRLIAWHVR